MHLILLSNDTIFRALSDGIYKIFSVLDLKNSFSVINQSTLKNKTSHQENETFNIMSNILLKYNLQFSKSKIIKRLFSKLDGRGVKVIEKSEKWLRFS